MSVRLRDGSMSGRSPFTPTKGPEQMHSFGGGMSGPLLKEKMSFNLFINGSTSYVTPNLNVALPGGTTRSEALLIFNDRPVGVARNTERARGVFNMSANFSYVFSFGGSTVALPPGIRIVGGGAGPVSVESVAQPDAKRYRLTFNMSIQNLTNHRNYSGFSGTMTSPFFRQPTNVTPMRRVDMGLNFSF